MPIDTEMKQLKIYIEGSVNLISVWKGKQAIAIVIRTLTWKNYQKKIDLFVTNLGGTAYL